MSETRISGVRQRIAMLFQGGALFDSISVGGNVAYGLHEHFRKQMTEAQIADRVNWALSLVGGLTISVGASVGPQCAWAPKVAERLAGAAV